MVKIISLEPSDRPPPGARYVIVEWSSGKVTSFGTEGRSLHYVIGLPKHRFWSTEAILMAARLGFEEIYYVGRPSEFAWTAATTAPPPGRRDVGKRPSSDKRKRPAGSNARARPAI